MRDTAEDEERYAGDRNVETSGDERMGELVQDDREEEAGRAHDPHRPIGERFEPRIYPGEIAGRERP